MKVEGKENHTPLWREREKKILSRSTVGILAEKCPVFSFVFLKGGYNRPSSIWSLIFKVKEPRVNGSMRNKIREYKALNLYMLSLPLQRW